MLQNYKHIQAKSPLVIVSIMNEHIHCIVHNNRLQFVKKGIFLEQFIQREVTAMFVATANISKEVSPKNMVFFDGNLSAIMFGQLLTIFSLTDKFTIDLK